MNAVPRRCGLDALTGEPDQLASIMILTMISPFILFIAYGDVVMLVTHPYKTLGLTTAFIAFIYLAIMAR